MQHLRSKYKITNWAKAIAYIHSAQHATTCRTLHSSALRAFAALIREQAHAFQGRCTSPPNSVASGQSRDSARAKPGRTLQHCNDRVTHRGRQCNEPHTQIGTFIGSTYIQFGVIHGNDFVIKSEQNGSRMRKTQHWRTRIAEDSNDTTSIAWHFCLFGDVRDNCCGPVATKKSSRFTSPFHRFIVYAVDFAGAMLNLDQV